ncbi:glutamine amidotransferase [Alcaligenaceae bacterium]|nr:glutamine amidotransferase [Alcaligenaceae bacterium]
MNPRKPLLILQMGYPPEDDIRRYGSQADWFKAALINPGLPSVPVDIPYLVVKPFLGEVIPAPETIQAAVISGSWAMVTDKADWSERCAAWVKDAITANTPLLGVCYGHQLMAYALGGVVDYNPKGKELGTQDITLLPTAQDDPLFANLPAHFPAHLTHEQSVLVPPKGTTVLASTHHDAHQILRYSPTAVSVQFHPEFTPAIMASSIERNRTRLQAQGLNTDSLIGDVRATPDATNILRRFVAHAYTQG